MKVSFSFPKSQIFYFDPNSASIQPLQIKSPTYDPSIKDKPTMQRQRKTKLIYRIKGLVDQNPLKEKAESINKMKEMEETTKCRFTIDLGHILPMSVIEVSSPNYIFFYSYTPIPNQHNRK